MTTFFVADGVTVKTMTVNDGYTLKTTDYPTVPFKMGYEGRWNYYTAAIYSDITVTATYTKPGGVIPVPTLPPSPPGIIAGDDEEPTEPDAEPTEPDAEPIEPDAEPTEPDAEPIEADASTGETPAEVAALSDREGQRLVSTQTVQHDYLTLNGKVARETITTDGTVTAILDFVYDESGRPFALNYSTNGGRSFDTYYYVLNLQGDVVKLVWYIPGFEYEAVAEYTYDAWGNILSATGSMAEINPLRYRGYYYDSETGFYYLQSRYYDPANRRFINADVFASTGQGFIGTNMFAYCLNMPAMLVDDSGRYAHNPNELVAMSQHEIIVGPSELKRVYTSVDDAAFAAGTIANLKTQETDLEHYCGIYEFTIYDSTVYFYSNISPGFHGGCYTGELTDEEKNLVPWGTAFVEGRLVAVLHSHPYCTCHGANEFSIKGDNQEWLGDANFVITHKYPLYLAAPNGNLYVLVLNGTADVIPLHVTDGLPVDSTRLIVER